MTNQVPVRISDEDLARIDAVVERGRFKNRSEVLRKGLDLVLREEREREIEEAYRRGYGEFPQEERAGEDGEALWEEIVRAEGREQEWL